MIERINENELKDLKEEMEAVFVYQYDENKKAVASVTLECSPFFTIMCC